ncbi:hypothetical protein ACQEVF_58105 [Nonomuraea polychroma]|uniref:hypothetical protein n=1 Tax=Nonomuraea polychroma TaxID=46176 RepID=UPI003D8AA085
MGKSNSHQRRTDKTARRKRRLAQRNKTGDRFTPGPVPLQPPTPATFSTPRVRGAIHRLIPTDEPMPLEQMARRYDFAHQDHSPVNGVTWTAEEFLNLEWVRDDTSMFDDEPDKRDEIVARYGEKIPADLAVLDMRAHHFIGVYTCNVSDESIDAVHITDVADTADLREALGILHRDGWIIPMANGELVAPQLFLQQIPSAPPHVTRCARASHFYCRFQLVPLQDHKVPAVAELMKACNWEREDFTVTTGHVWTPDEFRALPWLQPRDLASNDQLAAEYQRILQRSEDGIPADEAVLDLAASAFPGIVVGNFDLLMPEEVVVEFTHAQDLRQALGLLHRDGLLLPLANGMLAAPTLAKTLVTSTAAA